ncbi:MAG: VacJ family lipoprotein [Lysobacter sp.]|nr:VacJ family lipoprotein [Lysobacter sp.]
MTRIRLLATAFVALSLLSGCAHKAAVSEPKTDGTLVTATATDAAPSDMSEAEAMRIAAATDRAATEAASAANAAAEAALNAAALDASDTATTDAPAADGTVEGDTRTDAERDFDALYGQQDVYGQDVYDPVADSTLPPPAQQAASYDPWEKFNRRVHRFNNAVDRRVAKPLATAYVNVVPRPVRLGVGNFFNNLSQPVSAVNALLQGKPKQAGQSMGRFLLNSTLGVAGIFDPATAARIPNKSEDFGQTLGVWGWKKSRYIELPLFGPRTFRDIVGMAGDAPLSPIRQIEEDRVRVFLQGLQLVDLRAQLMSTDSFREGAADDYALVRDAWMQRRQYQIQADTPREGEDALPDYLKDEDNPTVPIDAMPSPDL